MLHCRLTKISKKEQIAQLEAKNEELRQGIINDLDNPVVLVPKEMFENFQAKNKQLKEIIRDYYKHCGRNKQICGLNYRAEQALKGDK